MASQRASKLKSEADRAAEEARLMEERLNKLKEQMDMERQKRQQSAAPKSASGSLWRSTAKAEAKIFGSATARRPEPKPVAKEPDLYDNLDEASSLPYAPASSSSLSRSSARPRSGSASVTPSLTMDALRHMERFDSREEQSYPSYAAQPGSLAASKQRQNIGGLAGSSVSVPKRQSAPIASSKPRNYDYEEIRGGMAVGSDEPINGGGGGSLWGKYDEGESKTGFLDALKEWRGPSAATPAAASVPAAPAISSKSSKSSSASASISAAGAGVQTEMDASIQTRKAVFKKNLELAANQTYFEQLLQSKIASSVKTA